MVVAQALVGLGYAAFGFTVPAIVGEAFSYEIRGRAMGLLRLSVSAASLVGVPLASALAERIDPRRPYLYIAIAALTSLAVMTPLGLRFARRPVRPDGTGVGSQLREFLGLLAQRRSARVSLIGVLAWAAVPTSVFIYLAAWLEGRFGVGGDMVGVAFLLAGCGALVGDLLTASLADRLGKKRGALFGLLLTCGVGLALPHAGSIGLALALLAGFTASLEFGYGSFSTLMTEQVPEQRATLLSLGTFVNGLGTAVVPLLGGLLWEQGGYASVTGLAAAFGVAIAVVLAAFLQETAGAAGAPAPP